MNRRLWAARVIGVVGVFLVAVSAIHLAVTPLLKRAVLDRVLTREMVPVVVPPFLLNHVVVGLLLAPLGFIALYSAGGIRAGERWAWVVSWWVGVGLVGLPVALVVIMQGERFNAVPFRVAEVLVTISAVAMPSALVWARREFCRGATGGTTPEK